jgi:hypothetical protein
MLKKWIPVIGNFFRKNNVIFKAFHISWTVKQKGKNLNCPSGRKAKFGFGSIASINLKFYDPVIIVFRDESIEYLSLII